MMMEKKGDVMEEGVDLMEDVEENAMEKEIDE